MMLIQIFFLIFFCSALVKVWFRFVHRDIRILDTLLWSSLWLVGIIIVIVPNSTFFVAHFLGVGRGADLVVYVALLTIFYIVFRLTIALEKIQRTITLLTRNQALKNANSAVEISVPEDKKI